MTPQELKNSILQLAIQGKLVEQRAEEGTAAELLRDILTQRRVTAAQAGLAIRSEPSRAERVPRGAKCAENEICCKDAEFQTLSESMSHHQLGE